VFVKSTVIATHRHRHLAVAVASLFALPVCLLIFFGRFEWALASLVLALGIVLFRATRQRAPLTLCVGNPGGVSVTPPPQPDVRLTFPPQLEPLRNPRLDISRVLRRAQYSDDEIHTVLHRFGPRVLGALADAALQTDREPGRSMSADTRRESLRGLAERALLDIGADTAWLTQHSPDRMSDWDGIDCSYCGFEPSVEKPTVERVELEMAMRTALENKEFRVHYQPIISLADRRVTELEARVCWERPGHGLLGPIAFIPSAEESGLSVSIGKWVLEQACLRARILQQRHRSPQALFPGPLPRPSAIARPSLCP